MSARARPRRRTLRVGRAHGDALRAPADLRGRVARRGTLGEPGPVDLIGRSADGVAEALLETVGAPAGPEAPDGLRLLARPALAVEPLGPRRARLADPDGAVDGDGREERADGAVEQPVLGEAGDDEGEQRADDHDPGDHVAGAVPVDRDR